MDKFKMARIYIWIFLLLMTGGMVRANGEEDVDSSSGTGSQLQFVFLVIVISIFAIAAIALVSKFVINYCCCPEDYFDSLEAQKENKDSAKDGPGTTATSTKRARPRERITSRIRSFSRERRERSSSQKRASSKERLAKKSARSKERLDPERRRDKHEQKLLLRSDKHPEPSAPEEETEPGKIDNQENFRSSEYTHNPNVQAISSRKGGNGNALHSGNTQYNIPLQNPDATPETSLLPPEGEVQNVNKNQVVRPKTNRPRISKDEKSKDPKLRRTLTRDAAIDSDYIPPRYSHVVEESSPVMHLHHNPIHHPYNILPSSYYPVPHHCPRVHYYCEYCSPPPPTNEHFTPEMPVRGHYDPESDGRSFRGYPPHNPDHSRHGYHRSYSEACSEHAHKRDAPLQDLRDTRSHEIMGIEPNNLSIINESKPGQSCDQPFLPRITPKHERVHFVPVTDPVDMTLEEEESQNETVENIDNHEIHRGKKQKRRKISCTRSLSGDHPNESPLQPRRVRHDSTSSEVPIRAHDEDYETSSLPRYSRTRSDSQRRYHHRRRRSENMLRQYSAPIYYSPSPDFSLSETMLRDGPPTYEESISSNSLYEPD